MEKGSERIGSIDLLRALAIFLIICFHLAYDLHQNNSIRIVGFIGVSLFFIISGFLLAKKYPYQEGLSLRWFFKRYLKIASIYYVSLLAIVLLFGKQVYFGSLWKNLIYHFFFLDFLSENISYGIISPAWFIVPLIGLYILFPYLNKYTKKTPWFLASVFIVMALTRIHYGTFTEFNPLFFIGEFCFGIACAYGMERKALLISLITILVLPIMVIPFLIFFFVFSLDWKFLPDKVLGIIGANTVLLFLFHEAVIKVALGKWEIYPLGRFNSLFLIFAFMIGSSYISGRMQGLFSSRKKKIVKRRNKFKMLQVLFVSFILIYSLFLVYNVATSEKVSLSPGKEKGFYPLPNNDYFGKTFIGKIYDNYLNRLKIQPSEMIISIKGIQGMLT